MSLESRRGSQLHDPGAEMLDRAGQIWSDYGRIILGGLVVVAAVVAGVIFFQRNQAQTESQAARQLAEATMYFWQGDYPRSQEIARTVVDRYGSTASGKDALRLLGDNAFWSGDYKTAIEHYRTYLESDRSGLLADAARRSLAYALESDGQPAEAAGVYASLVGKFDRESDGEMLLAAARCEMAAGRPEAAKPHLETLVNQYGETSHARRGREMLAQLELGFGAGG